MIKKPTLGEPNHAITTYIKQGEEMRLERQPLVRGAVLFGRLLSCSQVFYGVGEVLVDLFSLFITFQVRQALSDL